MKYIIIPAYVLLFSVTAFSQSKQYKYYFDKDLNAATPSAAVIKGIGEMKEGLLEFRLYNVANDHLISVEHYSDSSLKIENGLFQTYNIKDQLLTEGAYSMGKKDGPWIEWDSVGRVTDSTLFAKDKVTLELKKSYASNGRLQSLTITNNSTNEMESTSYNDDGQLWGVTKFKGNDGIVMRYDKSVLISTDTVHSREEREAEFEGGEQAWRNYIGEQVNKHIKQLTRAGVSGTCRVRFIINKDGNIEAVEATTMQGTELARVIVSAIKNAPKWKPASQYGRPVKAFREQPIAFKVE